MFTLIASGPIGGDGTSRYSVNFNFGDPLPTVEEFITDVITNHKTDWGTIMVRNDGDYSNEIAAVSYRHGVIERQMVDDRIKRTQIKEIFASGGWSRMDYIIYI